jgi:signal transduction histidine kinase
VTELSQLLREAEDRWHGPLAAKGRPLRVGAADGLAARGSPGVLGEILEVLLDNAHRHGAGTVTMSAREAANDTVAVDVADDGNGLSGDPEAAFGRGGSGTERGHGIGLHLARSLALAEDGRLVVTRAGPHPVFTLLMPRSRPEDAEQR